MVFRDLIKQILQTQDCDEHELAHELGCTPVQIKNLRDGKTKLPHSDTCKRLFRYCTKNNIDYSFIDWNDIAYSFFIDKGWIDQYTWLEDLDDDAFVLLKHDRCGKKTKVPFSALVAGSIPCIHCWVRQYVPNDSYSSELSEDASKHKFTHTCGHSYEVTYEQIKQKKYRCPKCGARTNAGIKAELPKNDYSFINKPKLQQYWMDYDYLERYITSITQKQESVWFNAGILIPIGEILLKNALKQLDTIDGSFEDVKVYYTKFELSAYLEYCRRFEGETIDVDYMEYPDEKNLLFITAKLSNGKPLTIGYISQSLVLHNAIGFVFYGTEGDDDPILAMIRENAEFYENLPSMDLDNLQYHIRENKARQSLYLLVKSFSDVIDLGETLGQVDQQVELLQSKLTVMEALNSFNTIIDSANAKSGKTVAPPTDDDDEEFADLDDEFDDEDFDFDDTEDDYESFDDEDEN